MTLLLKEAFPRGRLLVCSWVAVGEFQKQDDRIVSCGRGRGPFMSHMIRKTSPSSRFQLHRASGSHTDSSSHKKSSGIPRRQGSSSNLGKTRVPFRTRCLTLLRQCLKETESDLLPAPARSEIDSLVCFGCSLHRTLIPKQPKQLEPL